MVKKEMKNNPIRLSIYIEHVTYFCFIHLIKKLNRSFPEILRKDGRIPDKPSLGETAQSSCEIAVC